MRKPLVSVIIPAYNEERYLSFCLSSLLGQSFRNFEIILIDDGSTDKTPEIAEKFSVSYFLQDHLGTGKARNLGAKKARGEILVFVDADMIFDTDFLNYLILPIIDGKAIGTFQEEELVANPENIWASCWSYNSDLPAEKRRPGNLPQRSGVFRAILKDDFLRVGGFDSQKGYMDDKSLSEKVGIKSAIAPGSKCYHYNPESLREVFLSSRWIGRSSQFPKNFTSFLRYSLLNSIRIGFRNVLLRKQTIAFLIFKIVYDWGMLTGIFFGRPGGAK